MHLSDGDFGSTGFLRRYERRDVIFHQDEFGTELFIILSGSVGIFRDGPCGAEQLAQLGPGEFFGEMAVVDHRPRSARAVAQSDGTVLMAVDAARFVYLVAQQPGFAMMVMETLSRRQRGLAGGEGDYVLRPDTPATPYQVVPIAGDCWQILSRTRASNAYLFRGSRNTVLVDTCLPSETNAFLAALGEIGVGVPDIDLIVLTHEHFDHTGGVSAFGGRPRVAAHAMTANKIRLNDQFATMERAFDDRATPFSVDLELTHGAVIETGERSLTVHHTPGHSSGGISLHDGAAGLLVSGDTVLKGGHIGGIFGSGNISDLILSLESLKALRPSVMLPGHGRHSLDPMADIEETLARCHRLLGETRQLFDALDGNEAVRTMVNCCRDVSRGPAMEDAVPEVVPLRAAAGL